MYNKVWSKRVRSCISLFYLIKLNTISGIRTNKLEDVWYLGVHLYLNLKYFVVIPPFMMRHSWLFNIFFIHLMNVLIVLNVLNVLIVLNVLNVLNVLIHLTESKAFWMSTVTNIPFNFSISVICKTSAIKSPPSLINLRST